MFTAYLDQLHLYLYGTPITTFSFNESLLFGTTQAGLTISVIYLATLYILDMRKTPLNIPTIIPAAHNLFLTALSLILFIWMNENAVTQLLDKGLFYSVCDYRSYTPRVEFIMYLNYLTKYYELIDTLFLVLKKKKLEFLHVYHHSMTMLLCLFELQGRPSVSWVIVYLNLAVHVVMYFYYFLASLKIRVPWKIAVTIMQITQFVLDLGFCYGCCAVLVLETLEWTTWHCSGSTFAAVFGVSLLTSYLFLFIGFYYKTYLKKKSSTKVEEFKKKVKKNK